MKKVERKKKDNENNRKGRTEEQERGMSIVKNVSWNGRKKEWEEK